MTAKMRHLSRWRQLPPGDYLSLPGETRVVELELNVDMPTRFDVVQAGKATFLKLVEPGQCPVKVQFAVEGDCEVVPTTEGEVWYFTDDGEILNFAVTTESFTKLGQHTEMTTEMELTIYKAKLRAEERRREQAELLLAKQRRDEAAAADADPETGELHDQDGDGLHQGAAGEGADAGDSTAPEPEPAGETGATK